MPQKLPSTNSVRRIALCYIRVSRVQDETDFISPARQRDNIQAVCDREGWMPEWYEDVGIHNSGMHEHTRRNWMALKVRLGDPDIAALVANDLSRLHRNSQRINELLYMVEERGIRLVLADPHRPIDLDSPNGRALAQAQAYFDEWLAKELSERRKASIVHRKSQGKSAGMPPFGTIRDKDTGFLIPSDEGAWLLPDGSWKGGNFGQLPPVEGAIWRGYYECAEKILRMYAADSAYILVTMHREGWAFRDRYGQPAPLSADVIRRVVANWAEYGGFVFSGRARQRRASDYSLNEIIAELSPERAAFPIALLTQVGQVHYQRLSKKERHPNQIEQTESRTYPLGGIVRCTHCERVALQENNHKRNSVLAGRLGKYYRHPPRIYCGVEIKSVRCDRLEVAFVKLLNSLMVKPEAIDDLERSRDLNHNEAVFEKQRAEAISLSKQRMQIAVDLYAEGKIPRAEFFRRIEQAEREMALLENSSPEASAGQMSAQAALCIQALEALKRTWESGSAEDRQGMTRQMFEYVLFDLDTESITGFQLKPWAKGMLFVREEG